MTAFPSWAFTRCHHHSNWGSGHPIAAHYSFIDPERMKGWVGLVGWPIADGLDPYHNYDKTYCMQLTTLQLTRISYHICNKTYNNSHNTCTTVVELISIKTCMHNIMQVVVSCSQSEHAINTQISKFVNKKHDGDEKVKKSWDWTFNWAMARWRLFVEGNRFEVFRR